MEAYENLSLEVSCSMLVGLTWLDLAVLGGPVALGLLLAVLTSVAFCSDASLRKGGNGRCQRTHAQLYRFTVSVPLGLLALLVCVYCVRV